MYFCKVCKKYFSSKKSIKKNHLWETYSESKQTQKQIASKLGLSREWINKQLKKEALFSGKNLKICPQPIVLIIDTTYFRQFGLMVFRSSNLKQNLLWKIVDHETNEEYRSGIQALLNDGWGISGIVADGKPGLGKLFPDIPFQLCQFHQFQTVTRYISKNPKLEASRELRQIMFYLKETDKASFEYWITQWYEKWKDFLAEKTIDPFTRTSNFTHQRLRQAFFGIRRNLEALFVSQFHSDEIKIPNTTNSLDSYFGHLKSKLSVHRGASKQTQINLISQLIFR
jgi:DNA-binding XRE family transcriptional regulator